jgi:exodeoxyribonuclease VII small subunit
MCGIIGGDMGFEENLANLERIVSEMESGRLSLDDMMKNFEEGKKLVASCTRELESVRKRIEKVVSGSQEPPQVEPLEII